MSKMFLFVCLLFHFAVYAQTPKGLVSFGQPDSINSGILKEKRILWVYSPGVDTNYFEKPAYPVLYVLDGDNFFASFQTMMQLLSTDGNTAFPQMIIVGILNTDRTRDLTPTANSAMPNSGGGEQFTAFMEKELIPYIDSKYPTAPYRILFGHSLGGLLVTNTLLHHPRLFNAYIASDPSLFWNDSRILSNADSLLQHNQFNNGYYYLAIAHTMKADLDTIQVRKDNAMGSLHTTAILQFANKLKGHGNNQLKWRYKYYEDDHHKSVPFIAAYDALRLIFRQNVFPTYLFTDKSGNTDSLKTLITRHYKALTKEMGYPVRPYEWEFNNLGYHHLFEKNYAKAQMFFQLNIDYFPRSYNTYDSMADYYMATGDTTKAVSYWKQAMNIKPVPWVKEKLEKVNGGK